MAVEITTTGYARLSRFGARAVLTALLLSLAGCLVISLSPLSSGFVGAPRNKGSDVELYRAWAIFGGQPVTGRRG